ncbi:CBS domain-containing protein [Hoeflea poritis]|uniref:Diguanylate cyclase n=1 Tax=Hoeflea poritis TaxID=2993659 RepID=A0ABT4VKH4_9HYPH|nr:CBS domain-containing protein [Hoeflea poritis]MDA4845217.1 diguanylate cyclase [Hoeflea poritis]
MRISELLTQKYQLELKSIQPDQSLFDAAHILCAYNIGALPVVGHGDRILGILSERDLVRSIVKFQDRYFGKSVADIMTTDVITCGPNDPMDDIYELMVEKKIRHMPVVEGEKIQAMLSIRDFEFAHRRLMSQSLVDSLTGVPNSQYLTDILDAEFNRYRRFHTPLSVAVVKVDRYDEISTDRGDAACDHLLKWLAEIMVRETRAYDSIGRTAEDRFAIVFPNTDGKSSARACERLMRAIRTDPAAQDGGADWSSVSIGLAQADREMRDGERIMMLADERAEAATKDGGNCIEAPDAGPADPEDVPAQTTLRARREALENLYGTD